MYIIIISMSYSIISLAPISIPVAWNFYDFLNYVYLTLNQESMIYNSLSSALKTAPFLPPIFKRNLNSIKPKIYYNEADKREK
jgi:hypothetical protein